IARYSDVNTQGTALLLEAMNKLPSGQIQRVILSSSRSVYGEGAYRCRQCLNGSIYPEARTAEQLAAKLWDPICPKCNSTLFAAPTTEEDLVAPASIYAATKYAQEDLIRIACSSKKISHIILRLQNVYGEGQSLNNPYTGILSIF